MLNVAIYGMGNWGSRLIESVQGKSDKIKFVCGITRDPAAHRAAGGGCHQGRGRHAGSGF